MICSFHRLFRVEKIAVSAWHLLQRPFPRPDRFPVLPWQKTLPMQSSVCRFGDVVEYVLFCYVYHCVSIRYISLKVPLCPTSVVLPILHSRAQDPASPTRRAWPYGGAARHSPESCGDQLPICSVRSIVASVSCRTARRKIYYIIDGCHEAHTIVLQQQKRRKGKGAPGQWIVERRPPWLVARAETSPSSILQTVLLGILAVHIPLPVVVSGGLRRHSGRCLNASFQLL